MSAQFKRLTQGEFPGNLNEIPDPPEELFVAGEVPPPEHTFLCVVGSRKHTSYGKDAAERIIAGLKGYPIVIVSGLAIGIDSIAHTAALKAGLTTVAVPGSGLNENVLYPATNRALAKKILEQGGALISPFKPDFKATEWSFPARNRIMAGMSKAVLLIEAEEKSGTLITARLALDYNRDVYAIPGSIFSPTSRGTNKLIAEGATPITESSAIISALGLESKIPAEETVSTVNDLSPEEFTVWESLREPRSRDELIHILKMPISRANELISLMEIKGVIKDSGNKLSREE